MVVEKRFKSQLDVIDYVKNNIGKVGDIAVDTMIKFDNSEIMLDRKKQEYLKGNVKNALIASKLMTKEDVSGYDSRGRKPSTQGSGMNVSAIAVGNPRYKYATRKRAKKEGYKLYINPTINCRDDIQKLTEDAYVVAQIVDYLQFVGIDIEIYLSYASKRGTKSGDDILIEFPLMLNKKTFGIDYKTVAKYSSGLFFRGYIFGVFYNIPNIASDFGTTKKLDYALNMKDIKDEKQLVEMIRDNLKLALA